MKGERTKENLRAGVGQCTCGQGLAGARGAIEEDSAGRGHAETGEKLRVQQRHDDHLLEGTNLCAQHTKHASKQAAADTPLGGGKERKERNNEKQKREKKEKKQKGTPSSSPPTELQSTERSIPTCCESPEEEDGGE